MIYVLLLLICKEWSSATMKTCAIPRAGCLTRRVVCIPRSTAIPTGFSPPEGGMLWSTPFFSDVWQ
jgi:hypothetical protein